MIEVRFLNTMSSSSSVRRRTFTSEGEYTQWLASVGAMVEIVSVRPAVTA